jgi:hypothetical protein
VVLRAAAGLDQPTRPRRSEIRIRILPPPQLLAAAVAAQNQIQIAIPVNVVTGPTGFDRQRIIIDDMQLPAAAGVPLPSLSPVKTVESRESLLGGSANR